MGHRILGGMESCILPNTTTRLMKRTLGFSQFHGISHRDCSLLITYNRRHLIEIGWIGQHMGWKRRAIIQHILAAIPGGRLFYYQVGQKRLGQLKNPEAFVDDKVNNANELIAALTKSGGEI